MSVKKALFMPGPGRESLRLAKGVRGGSGTIDFSFDDWALGKAGYLLSLGMGWPSFTMLTR
ncbi:MAG: hypothetical protein NVSMB26_19350 [Beijerinckiaceae bacterium]